MVTTCIRNSIYGSVTTELPFKSLLRLWFMISGYLGALAKRIIEGIGFHGSFISVWYAVCKFKLKQLASSKLFGHPTGEFKCLSNNFEQTSLG